MRKSRSDLDQTRLPNLLAVPESEERIVLDELRALIGMTCLQPTVLYRICEANLETFQDPRDRDRYMAGFALTVEGLRQMVTDLPLSQIPADDEDYYIGRTAYWREDANRQWRLKLLMLKQAPGLFQALNHVFVSQSDSELLPFYDGACDAYLILADQVAQQKAA